MMLCLLRCNRKLAKTLKITNLVKITRLRGESESRDIKRGSKVVMKTTRSKSREDAEAKEEEPIYNFDEASIRVSFTRKV